MDNKLSLESQQEPREPLSLLPSLQGSQDWSILSLSGPSETIWCDFICYWYAYQFNTCRSLTQVFQVSVLKPWKVGVGDGGDQKERDDVIGLTQYRNPLSIQSAVAKGCVPTSISQRAKAVITLSTYRMREWKDMRKHCGVMGKSPGFATQVLGRAGWVAFSFTPLLRSLLPLLCHAPALCNQHYWMRSCVWKCTAKISVIPRI